MQTNIKSRQQKILQEIAMAASNKKYDLKDHKQWCDQYNKGITYFGIHPEDLLCDTSKFDVFHMRSAVC